MRFEATEDRTIEPLVSPTGRSVVSHSATWMQAFKKEAARRDKEQKDGTHLDVAIVAHLVFEGL